MHMQKGTPYQISKRWVIPRLSAFSLDRKPEQIQSVHYLDLRKNTSADKPPARKKALGEIVYCENCTYQ